MKFYSGWFLFVSFEICRWIILEKNTAIGIFHHLSTGIITFPIVRLLTTSSIFLLQRSCLAERRWLFWCCQLRWIMPIQIVENHWFNTLYHWWPIIDCTRFQSPKFWGTRFCSITLLLTYCEVLNFKHWAHI